MTELQTQRSYQYTKTSGAEKGGGMSKTRPNMSMSIKEMLHKFAVPPLDFNNGFTGDELPVDANRMDLAELQQLRDNNARRMEQLAKEVEDKTKLRDEKVAAQRMRAKELEDALERMISKRSVEDGVKSEPDDK